MNLPDYNTALPERKRTAYSALKRLLLAAAADMLFYWRVWVFFLLLVPAAFYVRDHGVGMTREQIRRILTDQKQVKSSVGTDGESGTGYGLILCRELLNLCHCKLDIQSVKGEGTTFTIDLQHAYYPINKYENRYTR